MPVQTAGTSTRWAAIYLNNHLAGATAGVELARRVARSAAPEATTTLKTLAAEIEEDCASLREIMRTLDVPQHPHMIWAGWLAEKAGRLKLNGRIVRRSPLSDLIELEGMLLGVQGKAAGWRALRELAASDPRLDAAELERLIDRANRQAETLESLRRDAAAVLSGADEGR